MAYTGEMLGVSAAKSPLPFGVFPADHIVGEAPGREEVATSPLPFGVFPADHALNFVMPDGTKLSLHCLSAFSRLITPGL